MSPFQKKVTHISQRSSVKRSEGCKRATTDRVVPHSPTRRTALRPKTEPGSRNSVHAPGPPGRDLDGRQPQKKKLYLAGQEKKKKKN